jgi:DNA-binding transcriptional ArsR family regulator
MSKSVDVDALERIFHEPNRLAIMSALCAAEEGISFPELKQACGLTDGNLNRHLKALSDNEAVVIEKAFVNERPRTTVTLSDTGLARFQQYLKALESVLLTARTALESTPTEDAAPTLSVGSVTATA